METLTEPCARLVSIQPFTHRVTAVTKSFFHGRSWIPVFRSNSSKPNTKKHRRLFQASRALLSKNVPPAEFARPHGWQMLRPRWFRYNPLKYVSLWLSVVLEQVPGWRCLVIELIYV